MRTLRLIIASLRLAWSPSSRPVIICLLVFSLLLPLATLLLLPAPTSEQHLPTVSISLVSNETGNDMLATIQTELSKIDLIEHVHTETLSEAQARLAAGETLLYIEFPTNFFVDSLAALKRDQVEIVLNENMPVEGEFFARMADEITVTVVELASGYFAYADLMRPYFATPEALQRHLDFLLIGVLMRLLTRNRLVTSQEAPKFDLVAFVSASLLVILILLAGMLPLFFATRDDRLGLSARFLASGLYDLQIQASRIVAGLPFAVLATAPLLLVVSIAFGFQPTLPLVLAMLALYVVQALIALLAARLDTETVTPVLVLFGLTFVHLLFGGVIYPFELLPCAVAVIGSYTPAAFLHKLAFRHFAGTENGVFPLGLALACLLFVLLLGVSARAHRRRLT